MEKEIKITSVGKLHFRDIYDGKLEIAIENNENYDIDYQFINKDEAIRIIDHLKTEFNINDFEDKLYFKGVAFDDLNNDELLEFKDYVNKELNQTNAIKMFKNQIIQTKIDQEIQRRNR